MSTTTQVDYRRFQRLFRILCIAVAILVACDTKSDVVLGCIDVRPGACALWVSFALCHELRQLIGRLVVLLLFLS